MSRKDTNIWLLLKEQQKQQKVGEFVNTRVFFPFFFFFFWHGSNEPDLSSERLLIVFYRQDFCTYLFILSAWSYVNILIFKCYSIPSITSPPL